MNGIIYTAIAGNYDLLQPQPRQCADFVAFTEPPSGDVPSPWTVRAIEPRLSTTRLDAKWYKIMPHRVFPDSPYTLWIDGNLQLTPAFSLLHILGSYLHSDVDLVLFPHPSRRCIYEEAWECRRRELDAPERLYAQVAKYTREGYPPNRGLMEAGFLLRRNNERMQALNEAWWTEITTGSVRDQISLPFLLWKHKVNFALLPGTIRESPWINYLKHNHEIGRPTVELRRSFL
jgi:hypothetical protein